MLSTFGIFGCPKSPGTFGGIMKLEGIFGYAKFCWYFRGVLYDETAMIRAGSEPLYQAKERPHPPTLPWIERGYFII